MKKTVCIILGLSFLLTGCEAVFAETGMKLTEFVEEHKPLTEQEATEYLTQTDEEYEFVFNEQDAYGTSRLNTSETETLLLNIEGFSYYPVNLPKNVEYITDNSKYIYARDSSVNVSILSGIDRFNFSASVNISNSKSLTEHLIVTDESKVKDEVREAALLLTEDKAIVVRTINNKAAFEQIVEGFHYNSILNVQDCELNVNDNTIQDKILFNKSYAVTITAGLGDQAQKVYAFEDGCLTISRELRKYSEILDVYIPKLVTMAGTDNADIYYMDDKLMYLEVGDYVFGCVYVNFNTVHTCYGYGNYAKENTKAYLLSQKLDSEVGYDSKR